MGENAETSKEARPPKTHGVNGGWEPGDLGPEKALSVVTRASIFLLCASISPAVEWGNLRECNC